MGGPTHDDWGNNMIASASDTMEKSFPRSIIDSPEVHKVTINRNSSGKVSSIEGKKVSDQYYRGSDTDYYGGFISAAPSGHPSQDSPLQNESKPRIIAPVPSHRKLAAPPGKDVFVDNAPVGQSSAPAPAPAPAFIESVIPLHDFFAETVPIQVEDSLVGGKDEIVSNPFSTPVGANLVEEPSAETPQEVGANLSEEPSAENPQEVSPNFELYGFDFSQLNLDTSPKVKAPKPSKGPSMK